MMNEGSLAGMIFFFFFLLTLRIVEALGRRVDLLEDEDVLGESPCDKIRRSASERMLL